MTRRASPAQVIADQIAQTRMRLSSRLADIDREYALRHYVVRGTRIVRHAHQGSDQSLRTIGRVGLPLAIAALGYLALANGREGQELAHRVLHAVNTLRDLVHESVAAFMDKSVSPEQASPPQSDGFELDDG